MCRISDTWFLIPDLSYPKVHIIAFTLQIIFCWHRIVEMASILVSEAEKVYVLHGVQEDLRCDGRGRKDVRPIVVETDIGNRYFYSNFFEYPDETEYCIESFMVIILLISSYSCKWFSTSKISKH